MDRTTPSGLHVIERVRPRTDARTVDPPVANGNAPSTVGPDNLDPGRFVMYPWNRPPPEAQAWSGWPVGWQPPNWNTSSPLSSLTSRVSTAWNALDLNASVLATMPPYALTGTAPVKAPNWITNPQPEVYASWVDFAKQMFLFYQMGEVFIWATARYANGYPSRFVCLRSDWVNVEFIDGVRHYALGGVDITPDVLHIRYLTVPGNAHGIGPLEAVAYSLLSAAALEKYTAELFANGGVPWAVLQFPDELDAAQVDDIHANWITARMRSMGAPAVISGGFELKPLSFNPREMALLDLRQFTETRIAVALGVPPYMLGLDPGRTSSLTYTNIAHLLDQHWRIGLNPKAATVMAALSGWLLPAGTNLELNRDDYVRPPLEQRAATYQALFNIQDPVTGERAIYIDEIRQMERLGSAHSPAALTGAATVADPTATPA